MEELTLKVNTGAVKVRFFDEADEEELGAFKFIPTDAYLVERWKNAVEKLNSIFVSEELKADEYKEIENQLKEIVDYIINYKASEEIFGKCSPLTVTVNGDFFFEVVLNGIADCIEKVFKTRVERKRAKINKALKKYK